MGKIAVYAGSFCPFTKGHEDIVSRAVPLFDRLVIAVGHNFLKKDAFSVEQRLQWIQTLYASNPSVEVTAYTGLTIDLCRKLGARYLVRGLRSSQDFLKEEELALVNRRIAPEVETLFLLASDRWRPVSSSMVRELWSLGADYTPFVSYKLPDFRL
jgi:pantetheine-phosphate adenylyltransferase